MNPLFDPAVERATRTFLAVMRREAHRRHPQRIENPVPVFDELGPIDRTILLNAMGHALKASATQGGDVVGEREPDRAPISTV